MTIKFEFPADRTDIALAIGQALVSLGGGASAVATGTAIHAAVESVCTNELIEEAQEQAQEANALDAAAVADLQATESANAAENAQASNPGEVDQKGVAKDGKYCADAAEPFYKSGKYKGQWKKRGGANGPSQEEYDAWYAGELQKVTTPSTNTPAPTEEAFDVGSTWSAPAANTPAAPTNPGELFAWVAEMQTAQRLTQADIDQAYAANNLTVPQMFGCTDLAVQGQMVTALYNTLNAKVPA